VVVVLVGMAFDNKYFKNPLLPRGDGDEKSFTATIPYHGYWLD